MTSIYGLLSIDVYNQYPVLPRIEDTKAPPHEYLKKCRGQKKKQYFQRNRVGCRRMAKEARNLRREEKKLKRTSLLEADISAWKKQEILKTYAKKIGRKYLIPIRLNYIKTKKKRRNKNLRQ